MMMGLMKAMSMLVLLLILTENRIKLRKYRFVIILIAEKIDSLIVKGKMKEGVFTWFLIWFGCLCYVFINHEKTMFLIKIQRVFQNLLEGRICCCGCGQMMTKLRSRLVRNFKIRSGIRNSQFRQNFSGPEHGIRNQSGTVQNYQNHDQT